MLNSHPLIITQANRTAEITGNCVQLSRLTPKGRSKQPLLPITTETPFEDALAWVFRGEMPEIEG